MKRISTIIIAAALLFGLAQCKKQETPAEAGKAVHITLSVGGNGGKHVVNPSGTVDYSDGDVIYVGNGGKYVGSLTREDGVFSGDIYGPSTADYLHFYFLGGMTPADAPAAGETTSFTIDIASQGAKLPVLSYAHSAENYTEASTEYAVELKNQCALVEFTLDAATDETVTLGGLKTGATVNFAEPGITPTETTSAITLFADSENGAVRYAILLPQEAVAGATVTIGENSYTVDVPAVEIGKYIVTNEEGDPITITPAGPRSFTVDFENGLPEGWTTIDADGDGYNWVLDTECESAYGYDQSNAGFNGGHMILSGSYHKTAGALHPDNYLVSPKVTLRSGSTFSFWAGSQDYQYPAEHFGVCVSDNGTSDWTMVQEWTMEAKGASGDKGFGRDGNTRDQGRWYYFSVDLSAYAGEKYIAIRHFDCSDQFFLNVDNIRLGDPEPGTSFSQNFNNSVLPEGWTTIDADGDGYNWVLTNQMAAYGYSTPNDGHYGTVGMTSGSYHGSAGALTPDNYLVTPKVNLVQGSTFSFWACAQDADYPAEHFGVYVSDNGTSGWTMVQEWTMTAKGASGNKGNGRDGNTRDIGNWYQYTVDLSAYAGEKYIAIRHFNCSDEFFLEVDDILLTVNR